ncbi:MAG: hypothetical protein AB7K37_00595 [Cyclobacteriaceae bacterium]
MAGRFNKVVGVSRSSILSAVSFNSAPPAFTRSQLFGDGKTAQRILKLLSDSVG